MLNIHTLIKSLTHLIYCISEIKTFVMKEKDIRQNGVFLSIKHFFDSVTSLNESITFINKYYIKDSFVFILGNIKMNIKLPYI